MSEQPARPLPVANDILERAERFRYFYQDTMPGLEVNLPTSDRTRIWFLCSEQAISILSPVISAIISKHNLISEHLQSHQALAKLLTRIMHTEAMITDHIWLAVKNIYNTC